MGACLATREVLVTHPLRRRDGGGQAVSIPPRSYRWSAANRMQFMADSVKTAGRVYLETILAGRTSPPPFASLLGMRLTGVGDGTAQFEMPVTTELYNPNDVVHGGAITSLLDSAMGLAVLRTIGDGVHFSS